VGSHLSSPTSRNRSLGPSRPSILEIILEMPAPSDEPDRSTRLIVGGGGHNDKGREIGQDGVPGTDGDCRVQLEAARLWRMNGGPALP
jgi:hypothetical protein